MNFPEEIWERVRNMAVYFVEHTTKVNRMKLNKLFYLADVEAFKKTAFTLSDQKYIAENFGPVPVSPKDNRELWDAFSLEDFFATDGDLIYSTKPGVSFDNSEFTDQELEILKSICVKYCNNTGDELSEITHDKKFSWKDVWNNGNGLKHEVTFEKFESGLSDEEMELRNIWRMDAKRNYESFEKLRACLAEENA